MNYCSHCGLADDITDRCTKAEDEARKLKEELKGAEAREEMAKQFLNCNDEQFAAWKERFDTAILAEAQMIKLFNEAVKERNNLFQRVNHLKTRLDHVLSAEEAATKNANQWVDRFNELKSENEKLHLSIKSHNTKLLKCRGWFKRIIDKFDATGHQAGGMDYFNASGMLEVAEEAFKEMENANG